MMATVTGTLTTNFEFLKPTLDANDVWGTNDHLNWDKADTAAKSADFVSASGDLQSQIDAITAGNVIDINSVAGSVVVTGTGEVDVITVGQTITISGTTHSTTLQGSYDDGDGTITTVDGKPLELDGTGELTAVTGTFTTGLTIGTGSTHLTGDVMESPRLEIITVDANAVSSISVEGDDSIATIVASGTRSLVDICALGENADISIRSVGSDNEVEIKAEGPSTLAKITAEGSSSGIEIKATGTSSTIKIVPQTSSNTVIIGGPGTTIIETTGAEEVVRLDTTGGSDNAKLIIAVGATYGLDIIGASGATVNSVIPIEADAGLTVSGVLLPTGDAQDIDSINTVTGSLTLGGANGITIVDATVDSTTPILNVTGFRTEFVSASGTLQTDIDSKLANVVEDTTPQLGGDLDVQAQSITTSVTNGNINFDMNGLGDVLITSTDGGGASGPNISLIRDSASPEATNKLGSIEFFGEDTASASKKYARMRTQIVSPTAGSIVGSFDFSTAVDGQAFGPRMTIEGGLLVGPTVTDKGIGTLNADDIFIGGVSIPDRAEFVAASGTLQTDIDSRVLRAGDTMSGDLALGDNSLTGIDTITFTDAAGTIAAIQNQNLLDKTATEIITGHYVHAAALVISGTGNEVQLTISGSSPQSTALLSMEQSDGTDIFTVDNDGFTVIGDGGIGDSAIEFYDNDALKFVIGNDDNEDRLVIASGTMDSTKDMMRFSTVSGVEVLGGFTALSGTFNEVLGVGSAGSVIDNTGITTGSGIFTSSLTISGIAVSTGGSTVTLQNAYDDGDGTISTAGGKPLELTGTGELTAVTGTFTAGLTVGNSSSVINDSSITTGSGIFTNSLTIDGAAVTDPLTTGITLLSTTNVSLAANADTTLYTVPAGKTLILSHAIIVVGSDAGVTDISIGQDGAETDFMASKRLGLLNAANDAGRLAPPFQDATSDALLEKAYAAGTVIQAQITDSAGGATNNLYLFGTLF